MYLTFIRDICAQVEAVDNWEKPLRFSVVLEDEQHGIPVTEFYANMLKDKLGLRKPDSFNHYLVMAQLPQRDKQDKVEYMVVDQTEGHIRTFQKEEVDNRLKGEYVVKSADGSQRRFIELTEPGVDPSLAMAGFMLDGIRSLDGVAQTLNRSPRMLYNAAADRTAEIADRNLALTLLIQNYPYFIGETGLFQGREYSESICNLVDLCSQTQRPLIGLFLAHALEMHAIGTETTWRSEMINDLREMAALLNDGEWAVTMAIYKKLLLEEDVDWITKRRQELKEKEEREKERLREKAAKRLSQSAAVERITNAEVLLEPDFKRKETENQQAEAGSQQRTIQMLAAIDTHSRQQDLIFSQGNIAQPQLQQAGLVRSQGTARRFTIQEPLKLQPLAVKQAAERLVSDMTATNSPQILELYGALWRACVGDVIHDTDQQQAMFIVLTEAFQQVLVERNLLEAGARPFGSLEDLQQRTVHDLRRIIIDRFARQTPALLTAGTTS